MMGDLQAVLSAIGPNDRVLDVGGGLHPLSRADAVLDANPFPNAGAAVGVGPARYSEKTWTMHDVNDRRGFPYRDGEFDFVFCSHLLEDIRDPLFVCQEIQRVGKRGYIETPSRAHESSPGVQSAYFTGYMHHRWFVEQIQDGLRFTFKSPILAEFPFLHCPDSSLSPAMCFFWEGPFRVEEQLLFHRSEILEDLISAAAPWQRGGSAEKFRRAALRYLDSHEHRRSFSEKMRKRAAVLALRLQRRLASGLL